MERSDGPELDPSAAPGVLGGAESFGRALARWASEVSVDDAAAQRARQRWLRLQAEEEATLAGTLLDLAERGSAVVMHIRDQQLRGWLAGIGADFVALATTPGQRVLVPLAAIDVVRADAADAAARAPAGAVSGDRAPTVDIGLDGLVGVLAADRPAVAVRTTSGTMVRGQLRSASPTLLRVLPDGPDRAPAWVPVAQVALVVLDP